MNPKRFLDLAEILAQTPEPENIRSAISRSYYAAFHSGVTALEALGFRINKNSTGHQEVARNFNNSGVVEVQRAGQQLNDLRSRRIDADYKLEDRRIENQKNAQSLIAQAKRMIATIERECQGYSKEQIVAAISEYKRRTNT